MYKIRAVPVKEMSQTDIDSSDCNIEIDVNVRMMETAHEESIDRPGSNNEDEQNAIDSDKGE